MFPVSCDCFNVFKRTFMFDDSFCLSHEAFFPSRPESWSRDPWAVWDWIWCGAQVWGVCGQSRFRLFFFSGSSLAVLQQQNAAQSAPFVPFYSKLSDFVFFDDAFWTAAEPPAPCLLCSALHTVRLCKETTKSCNKATRVLQGGGSDGNRSDDSVGLSCSFTEAEPSVPV